MHNASVVQPPSWREDMDLATATAQQLFERANTAAREANDLRRDPNGGLLARVRQQDAEALRALARARLRT